MFKTQTIQIIIVACFLSLFAVPTFAAEIYFDSKIKEIGVSEKFEVSLFINTEQGSINALEAKIVFPSHILDLKEIRDGNSIVSFWIERPKYQNGAVAFSGVIPGGFNGERGLIFSAIFEARKEGFAKFEIDEARVLRNDGVGSEATLIITPLEMEVFLGVSAEIPTFPEIKDREKPESFVPEIAKDETLFDGKWFVVFATQDKASGIDHYEIKESRQKILSVFRKWTSVESPYVLQDQELRSYIFIKAVDRSGNERITELSPRYPINWYEIWYIWIIIIAIAVTIFIVIRISKTKYLKI